MLRNLFLVAIRNVRKNSLYSVINISGLSIGIACSILILLWVVDELTFDQFIPKSDKIYQVYVNAEFDGTISSWRSVPLPTYEAMKTADNDIVNTVVTGWGHEHLLTVGDKRVFKDTYWVSEEFLEIFEFPLVSGDPSTVLDDPLSIVITESTATALFGNEDPINKLVELGDAGELKVTGILKDIPQNSSFQFDFLVPWKYREQINEWVVENKDNWGNYSFQIFLELSDESKAGAVEDNIRDMLTEKGEDDIERAFFIYPMERWRLHSQFEDGTETGGIIEYVQLFSVIAIFILVIACINFMNLATARSEKRLKEVGIRKSIGSRRIDLIFQFLGESIVITLISYIIAIALVLLVLPSYNQMVEKELYLDLSSPFFWILSGSLILFTGLMGGSYPAFYLSSFSPVRTLKGSITIGKNASLPRKILVVLQFGVAIILMVGTVIIYQQIEMVKNRDLGYDMNSLITVDFTDELRNNYESLKNEILQSGAVESMTRSNSSITQINSNNFLGWPGKPEELRVIFTTITSEYDYTKTMGIEVLQGRDFSEDFKSDTAAIVINKAALDLMQLEDPLGTELDLWGDKRTLIGVVDDVLMGDLYREVKPMFVILNDWGGVITLRLAENQDYQSSLAMIEDIFERINPAYPFDYQFVDAEFEKKFTTIKLTRRLAIIFAVLAILITGLGLFGLASYTAEQRTKEIGIRKVMGATVPNLVSLMSRDFTVLVVVSFILSAPLAWVLLDKYLEKYPIRVDMEWWIFPITGLVALLFALFIVSNQARKAALANPVDSLRNE